jgi:hypothetical protein
MGNGLLDRPRRGQIHHKWGMAEGMSAEWESNPVYPDLRTA